MSTKPLIPPLISSFIPPFTNATGRHDYSSTWHYRSSSYWADVSSSPYCAYDCRPRGKAPSSSWTIEEWFPSLGQVVFSLKVIKVTLQG